jgi:hypothetical protein
VELIEVARTAISEDVGRRIAACPHLQRFYGNGRSIDERFARALDRHPSLVELDLRDTAVRGQFVDLILGIPSLRRVALPSSSISTDDIERLKSIRPELYITLGE